MFNFVKAIEPVFGNLKQLSNEAESATDGWPKMYRTPSWTLYDLKSATVFDLNYVHDLSFLVRLLAQRSHCTIMVFVVLTAKWFLAANCSS